LRNRLKQVEDNLTTCKKENEALTAALKAANDVDALNNTIRLLREELEFRAAEDKEVQKHIENYQLMNQKLR
jgi:AAA+ superfamily predicted ATPase